MQNKMSKNSLTDKKKFFCTNKVIPKHGKSCHVWCVFKNKWWTKEMTGLKTICSQWPEEGEPSQKRKRSLGGSLWNLNNIWKLTSVVLKQSGIMLTDNKRQPVSKEEFLMSFKKPWGLFLKTSLRNDKKMASESSDYGEE